MENLDTCRNEDLPPLLKQEAPPGIRPVILFSILFSSESDDSTGFSYSTILFLFTRTILVHSNFLDNSVQGEKAQ